MSQSPEDGEEGSVLAAPWRCLAFFLSRTKLATFSAKPRGWYYCLPALGAVSRNQPVLLQAASSTLRSCPDLMPQSAHLDRGEEGAFPPQHFS